MMEQSNLLNQSYVRLDPCEYQWQLENDELLPVKNLLLIPEEISVTCSCKQDDISKRCGGVCKCSRKGVKCTAMCGCQKTCANSPNAPMRPPKRKEPAKEKTPKDPTKNKLAFL